MSSSDIITKRLHVSGLTPHISAADLKSRFSSFGTVKGLDGLGKLDALGQPRPYAYVTLETTKPQLAKCLNLLSGTTWKGAKLRIGEAKPDYRERIQKENEDTNNEIGRSMKRRRLARGTEGVHAPDMSLVTPTSLRPGWRVTPLGRLVRPIRMRPLRPLPARVGSGTQRLAAQKKKMKVKKSATPVRQRRKCLDPEDWGSTYLSGIMLENGSGVVLPERPAKTKDVVSDLPAVSARQPLKERTPSPSPSPSSPASSIDVAEIPTINDAINQESHPTETQVETDLAKEAKQSLALLTSLFGSGGKDKDDDDWGGAESLSGVEMDAEPPATATMLADDDIEFVPREVPPRPTSKTNERERQTSVSIEVQDDRPVSRPDDANESSGNRIEAKVQTTKLKDMFAPRPEDAGFSILDNLDLDLELDEGLPLTSAPPSIPHAQPEPAVVPQAIPSTRQATLTLDPNQPFFFPHSLIPNSSLTIKPGDPRDIFSQEPDFFRTETTEEIRARWESRKVDLTRDWKRRHREAVKATRRRGGAQN